MSAKTMSQQGVAEGQRVKVGAGGTAAELSVVLDAGVPTGCVRVAAAHVSTVAVGPMFASLKVEKL
jgi:NADH-quinone oxidoreductase subunit G